MTDIGQTLRSARVARGEDVAACAAATGIGPRIIETLERGDLDGLPPAAHAADLVARYASHLGLDADELARQTRLLTEGDPDADTQRIPVVQPPARARDATLLWIGAGAVLGIGVLAVAGGGFGGGAGPSSSSDTPPASVTTLTAATTAATTTADLPAQPPATLRPAAPAGSAIVLRLDAQPGKTVWVEVRRGDVSGEQLFAGIVGSGATQTIRSQAPLWLGVAWAPNVALTLNGERLDTEGGTESYRVTARGITTL